jgi:RNA polymerase sigma-70 factor, ECF subfamily
VYGNSLDQLVREHLPVALRFATRLTGNADAAEEVVQEALVRVVRAWSGFRGEASFRTWFFGILIRVFRDRLARAGAEVSLDDSLSLVDSVQPRPEAAALAGELAERIAEEVSRLPPRQREVLVLSVYENLSPAEVAEAVGINVSNVYATLSLARGRLQARLASYLNRID